MVWRSLVVCRGVVWWVVLALIWFLWGVGSLSLLRVYMYVYIFVRMCVGVYMGVMSGAYL
jgi:hypothetical protein